MESIFLKAILFVFGASFASLAGAVTWRIKKRKNFVTGRSQCESCKHQLSPSELVPIFSWLLLKGKCKKCKKPIGAMPLFTEVVLGLVFVASFVFWPYGFSLLGSSMFVLWLVSLVFLTILFIYDARWFLLPDKVVLPLTVVASGFFVLKSFLLKLSFLDASCELVLSLLPIAGVYGAIYFFSRNSKKGEFIGFGDVKLGISLGILLGWKQALLALILANFLGFVFILPGILSGKITKGMRLPFGPFLILATILAFLFGQKLIEAYLALVFIY